MGDSRRSSHRSKHDGTSRASLVQLEDASDSNDEGDKRKKKKKKHSKKKKKKKKKKEKKKKKRRDRDRDESGYEDQGDEPDEGGGAGASKRDDSGGDSEWERRPTPKRRAGSRRESLELVESSTPGSKARKKGGNEVRAPRRTSGAQFDVDPDEESPRAGTASPGASKQDDVATTAGVHFSTDSRAAIPQHKASREPQWWGAGVTPDDYAKQEKLRSSGTAPPGAMQAQKKKKPKRTAPA